MAGAAGITTYSERMNVSTSVGRCGENDPSESHPRGRRSRGPTGSPPGSAHFRPNAAAGNHLPAGRRAKKKAARLMTSRAAFDRSNLPPIATVESLREERGPIYAEHKPWWPGFTQLGWHLRRNLA